MSFLQEFKEFAMKGNVVDLAVGVIIGRALQKIVDSRQGHADAGYRQAAGWRRSKALHFNLGDKTLETMEAAEKAGARCSNTACSSTPSSTS